MRERWIDIPGYEEIYRVSTLGRVRSLPRVDAGGNKRRGTILKSSMSASKGRRYYLLSKHGSVKMHCASALLASVYGIPNPRRCGYVFHVDGNYDNFQRRNLRWATLAEQRLHDGLKTHSPYYGVTRDKHVNATYPWIVQLSHGRGPRIWRGYATPEEAAYVYDQEVKRRGLKRPLNNVRRPKKFQPPAIKSLPGEIWTPIPGTRGTYLISSKGRVRRQSHVTSSGKRLPARLRKISVNARGFPSVLIRGRRYGIRTVMARVFRDSPVK